MIQFISPIFPYIAPYFIAGAIYGLFFAVREARKELKDSNGKRTYKVEFGAAFFFLLFWPVVCVVDTLRIVFESLDFSWLSLNKLVNAIAKITLPKPTEKPLEPNKEKTFYS